MITLLTLIHIMVSLFLILVVLLQQGKGQDFASTFGGGGTQAAFGARSGATLLHRLTTVAALLFMITSLSLTILISQPGTGSVIDEDALPVAVPAPQPEDTVPGAGGTAPGEIEVEPVVDDAPAAGGAN